MKRIALITALTTLSSCATAAPPVRQRTITSVTMTFDTTANDKDYNTQIRDHIECEGNTVAALECCSADRQKDHWERGSSETRDMTVLDPSITNDQLDQCKVVIGIRATGDDTWVFIPRLHATFIGATPEDWTFRETTLVSRDSHEVTITYFLK